MNATLDGAVTLRNWGAIRATGDDAAKFLHGQLTQDFALLGPDQGRLAAYCSAKGRMLASLIGYKQSATDIVLLCPRDVLEPTLRRLSQFVMRAKLKLSDASNELVVIGLLGRAADPALANGQTPWSRQVVDGATLITLYPVGPMARALWVATPGQRRPPWPDVTLSQWQWAEVRSGVAMVSAPLVEAFVPQMLNYESVGGVNFKKGCYPGQEVVARSQFRGTLKRRAFIVHADAELPIGAEVFAALDPSQPCGTVAAAAPTDSGGWDGIVCAQVASVESGALHLASAQGPVLAVLPLPYPLLTDV